MTDETPLQSPLPSEDRLFMPGPGVALWAAGREGLAQGLCPETLAATHPGWCKDALDFGPWQALSRPSTGTGGQSGQSGQSNDRGECSQPGQISEPGACGQSGQSSGPGACGQNGKNGQGGWGISQADAGQSSTRVLVCAECTSVLDVARYFTEAGANAAAGAAGLSIWDSVLAVSQSSGRGQLRRHWISPPGNLYACLVLPQAPPEFDSLVPLLLGECLAGYFSGLGLAMRLKWPNDLLYNGVKVGGLLVEERKGVVTVGIGVNLVSCPPAAALREDHAVPAGNLKQCFTPLALWRSLVDFLRICYEDALEHGSAQALAARIEARLAWLGQCVMVREGGAQPYQARLMGLAPDGALRVRQVDNSGVEKILTSGSIWPG